MLRRWTLLFILVLMSGSIAAANEWVEIESSQQKKVFEYRSSDLGRGESVTLTAYFPGEIGRALAKAMAVSDEVGFKFGGHTPTDDALGGFYQVMVSNYGIQLPYFSNGACGTYANESDVTRGLCYFEKMSRDAVIEISINTMTVSGGADFVAPSLASFDGNNRFQVNNPKTMETYRGIEVSADCYKDRDGFVMGERAANDLSISDFDIPGYLLCSRAKNAEIAGARTKMTVPLHVFYDIQDATIGSRLTQLKFPAVTNYSKREDGTWNAFAISIEEPIYAAYN